MIYSLMFLRIPCFELDECEDFITDRDDDLFDGSMTEDTKIYPRLKIKLVKKMIK